MKLQQRNNRSVWRPAARALAVVSIAALHIDAAPAQSLDSTLDDIVQNQLSEQVESQLSDRLQQTVEEQVESGVSESVEQQIEAGVSDGIEQQLESGIVDNIERHIDAGATQVLEQLDAAVEGSLADPGEAVGNALDGVVDGGRDAPLPTEQLPRSPQPIEDGDESEGGSAGPERFVADIDGSGRSIERDVWIILVPPQHVDRIAGWGFDVQEQQTLAALDRVLVRVSAPEDRQIAEAALELALDAPGTLVDFNHAYRSEAGETSALTEVTSVPMPAQGSGLRSQDRTPAIGIIDTAVAVGHEALRSANIVQKDFVPFDGPRPARHGTAVASIIVGQAPSLEGRLTRARLYAASVFFVDDSGNTLATTESLAEALEWLAAEQVRVINMSLSGPPNRVLEAAIDLIVGSGRIVVAAVGNNGPMGEPLFPAAYEDVVGVTAVDAENQIYRYANRGPQVMFSAPGVDIQVALADGYGAETGTSMAAPHAAAVIARLLTHGSVSASDVLSSLKASALDLGDEEFDDVYGFGLIVGQE